MLLRRLPAVVAGASCLAWLTLTTGFGAAATPHGAAAGEEYPGPAAPVDLGGEPVASGAGSTSPAEPTALPPGLWTSTLAPNFPQYFSYERRIKDSRVHVGVVGSPQTDASDGLRVIAGVVPDGGTDLTGCGDENDSSESSVPHAVLGTSVVVGDEDGTTGDTCRAADTVQIQVNRGYASNPEEMPIAIKVVEEAPAAAEPADAEPDDDPAYRVPEPGSATEVPGAASFADAPLLDVGSGTTTISATVREGTELLWRVPLEWGDLPVVRVDVPVADSDVASYGGPDLSLHLVDPLRSRLRYTASGGEDSPTGEYAVAPADEAGEPDVLVASGFPVRRINGLLPGDHWISLAAEPAPEDRDPVDIPVEITVAVDGTGADAPSYNNAVLAQDDTAGPAGYSPEQPFLVAEDTFSAVASGNPVVGEDADDAWLTTRRWAGLGVAAASVACLAGGVVRLRSRR